MKHTLLCLLIVSLLVITPVGAQKNLSPPAPTRPAESALAIPRFPMRVSEMPGARIDADQVQRDAQELLDLTQSLQPDIASVNQGLLPKKALDKLKRIEKLSKHLRSELTP